MVWRGDPQLGQPTTPLEDLMPIGGLLKTRALVDNAARANLLQTDLVPPHLTDPCKQTLQLVAANCQRIGSECLKLAFCKVVVFFEGTHSVRGTWVPGPTSATLTLKKKDGCCLSS